MIFGKLCVPSIVNVYYDFREIVCENRFLGLVILKIVLKIPDDYNLKLILK